MSNNQKESTDLIEQDFEENSDNKKLSQRPQSGWGMQPANISEAMKLCKFLAASGVVPNDYQGKPEDIFVCIQHGQEIGLKPLQSLNSVSVINGRPTVDTSTHLALARQHPEFEWIREDNEGFAYARDNVSGWEHLENVDPNTTSICVVKRKGQPVTVREFSNEDVKTAGLGNVHNTYPKDMRRYRARGRALEAEFGDVLKGFKITEVEQENVKVYGEDYKGADQPEASDRKNIDIDMGNGQQAEDGDSEEKPDSSEKQSSTERKNSAENSTERTNGGESSTGQDAKELKKQQVNELGKELHGTNWYKEYKTYVFNQDETAENLLDLNIDELEEIENQLEYKLEKKTAAGA